MKTVHVNYIEENTTIEIFVYYLRSRKMSKIANLLDSLEGSEQTFEELWHYDIRFGKTIPSENRKVTFFVRFLIYCRDTKCLRSCDFWWPSGRSQKEGRLFSEMIIMKNNGGGRRPGWSVPFDLRWEIREVP